MAGISGILILPLLMYAKIFFACFCLLLTGYLDTLDGSLARNNNTHSNFGSALDIVMDRVVEFSIILGLFTVAPETRAVPCLLMLGSILVCVTSFLVVGIFTENQSEKSFHYSVGLMERAEAFIFFMAMILLPSYFLFLAYNFVCLIFWTTLLRMHEFYAANKKGGT